MAKVRSRKETNTLYFDFNYLGLRCREQTSLPDTAANRKKLQKVMNKIEAEITLGTFKYEVYFAHSSQLPKVKEKLESMNLDYTGQPTFEQFAWEWFDQMLPTWRKGTSDAYKAYLINRLIPAFGDKEVGRITKSDILNFRSTTTKLSNGKLKPKTINKFMKLLKMILDEAASRFDFTTPYHGIKPLKEEKVHIEPFSLEEVNLLLRAVRPDWKAYFITRFFTGMRTGEIDGLTWEHVDFDARQILVRQTYYKGEFQYTKNDGSQREIDMSQMVYDTLLEHKQRQTGGGKLVFPTSNGEPINNSNFLNRIWKPLLRLCNLKYRRPYQTRHTAATLWLAAGENPAWIANQMGHTDTQMLFRVYTRYVPDLTRKDGSAMENLITNNFNQHRLGMNNEASLPLTSVDSNHEDNSGAPATKEEKEAEELAFWDSLLSTHRNTSQNYGGAQ
ncbi:MAG: DUF3596 domain-containing protein [Hydrogenovibrio sp.]|uniref:Arm DNA-binding domain-containing protein n=1 Tax=Hydrogenovibrio sp. TaxID=2065821 RepID=UPI0028709F01|nr:DUF3596 domain-containing protein [Hydrogenovibrio sp.]MDR9500118.1 DUF3596 domain-containing protein [Hydrogenovibrio sp.]